MIVLQSCCATRLSLAEGTTLRELGFRHSRRSRSRLRAFLCLLDHRIGALGQWPQRFVPDGSGTIPACWTLSYRTAALARSSP